VIAPDQFHRMRALNCSICHRRDFLRTALAGSAALFTVPGVFAEALTATARQTEGPFYPDQLPLDTDNDLLILNSSITPAVGEVTHLTGVVMDLKGQPVRNALVEIWSTDNNGVYLHSKAGTPEKRDRNFQSYGRFLTGSKGEYYLRTIKPGKYPGRTKHIHFAISIKGKRVLTTQCYPEGEADQKDDMVIKSIKDPKVLKTVIVPFTPMEGSKTGELAARFDIVLGLTPDEGS
jgi:protocatechuate 3,4-dioxygenase beta subunit